MQGIKLSDIIDFNPRVKLEKSDIYSFIPMENLTPEVKFVSDVEKKEWEGQSSSKFENGDILFARIYPCLDNRKIAVAKTEGKGFGSTEFFVIRAKEGIADQNFVYYLSTSDLIVQTAINSYVGASGRQRADLKFIKNSQFDLPTYDNQKKIAAILSTYDDLIDVNKKRIEILENMAEELYKEWFVRFRFPNWENTEFEKGIPKEWKEKPISKCFEVIGGGTPSKDNPEYWRDGDINWFTPSDLTKASTTFVEESSLKCNSIGLAHSSTKIFPAYSVMMTSRATIGVLSINTTEACTNQGFITCLPNKEVPLTYLYYQLKFSKPHFEALASGATFPELSRGVFKKIKIRVAEQNIIDEFDKIVEPLFEQILNYQKMITLFQKQKNELLPRLMSGKLSVVDLGVHYPPSMHTSDEAEEK